MQWTMQERGKHSVLAVPGTVIYFDEIAVLEHGFEIKLDGVVVAHIDGEKSKILPLSD